VNRNITAMLMISVLILAGCEDADKQKSGANSAPDTTAPVITMNGSDTVTIAVGGSYNDAGAKAVDDVDGDISANIRATSTLDAAVSGTYAVAYNVADAAENDAVPQYRLIKGRFTKLCG